jgi:penicillin amidase
MSLSDPNPSQDDLEPRLSTRSEPPTQPPRRWLRLTLKTTLQTAAFAIPLLILLAAGGWFAARAWMHRAVAAALPQLDGTLSLPGLAAPVTVQRDAHGIPHIRAANLDDLVVAQGFVTAQDRLWQMDMLRRHAAGELAAVLGPALLPHDRMQRTLQIRAAADRAIAVLSADQLHWLTLYARGVNAVIDLDEDPDHPALPLEFRLLRYRPAAWTPRDSLLVGLAMFEDLTTEWPTKIARESLTARLPASLAADLYPVGSWRDHPPAAGVVDLSVEGPPIEEVPLDESQNDRASLDLPSFANDLADAFTRRCQACTPGSNNWAVSGAKTASGKPLLSNDMHLSLGLPGLWYEAALEAPAGTGEDFDVAGVSLPGTPFIIVGHNRHIAWGFTNLGADVQDIYIEPTRGTGAQEEFQAADGSWHPVLHHAEIIAVKGRKPVTLDVAATQHGGTETPILTPLLRQTGKPNETRTLALRWTAFDPSVVSSPFFAIDAAHDWTSFTAALANFPGPAQNAVYADDRGHIGYHATGRIPIRGPSQAVPTIPADIANPAPEAPATTSPDIVATPDTLPSTDVAVPEPKAPISGGSLSGVPLRATPRNEWSGSIPFDELPQVFDPPSGILATANANVAPGDFPYPITLNWAAPYRNERIWKTLAAHNDLTPASMLALEGDIYSSFDRLMAQRFAYAIDHSAALKKRPAAEQQGLRQAADLLRAWNGRMDANAPAPAIVSVAIPTFWQLLIDGHLNGKPLSLKELEEVYIWGEKSYALEQIVMHQPPRWLPKPFNSWDDLLAGAVDKALQEAHAPKDLKIWRYGSLHTIDIEHPIFASSPVLRRLLDLPTGTGPRPLSGDRTTIKQVDRAFGPSERLTVDFAHLDDSTLNIVLGQSGNLGSPWLLDQFPDWYRVSTYKLPFSEQATSAATTHTLTLQPRR